MINLLVADESVDFRIVTELRKLGLQVIAISENHPSIKDDEVLRIAFNSNAILLTEDKDFGDLVFRLKLPHKGVLLIRMGTDIKKITRIAEAITNHGQELYGKFSVIDENKLRIKE